ncbi:hypothetical protein Dimus_029801 [Dionaea muscipula]
MCTYFSDIYGRPHMVGSGIGNDEEEEIKCNDRDKGKHGASQIRWCIRACLLEYYYGKIYGAGGTAKESVKDSGTKTPRQNVIPFSLTVRIKILHSLTILSVFSNRGLPSPMRKKTSICFSTGT